MRLYRNESSNPKYNAQHGTKRGFRYVIFDVFGTTLDRPKLEDAFRTSAVATAAMWKALEAIDAKAVTLTAIDRQEKQYIDEMAQLRAEVSKL